MYPLVAVLVAATPVAVTPVYYQATVATFGCNSNQEVAELLSVRDQKEVFERQLLTQIVYGQCVGIAPGTILDGYVDETDATIVRLDAATNPPGYMAPLKDFKIKDDQASEGKAQEGTEKQ